MKICVLLPQYAGSDIDYQHYDPPRDLSLLLPEHEVHTVFLHKLTTYKQLKELSRKGYDIFVNLCEAYLEWDVPGYDVIVALELLKLPFTGPTSLLYDPAKELMKYVAYCSGVATPAYVAVTNEDGLAQAANLSFPLFVKPAKAGDSLGIDEHSMVKDAVALAHKVQALLPEYDELLVEEYIAGREFTVLVAANADGKSCTSFQPVEFIFPEGAKYKTYALKTSELHTDANIPVDDASLNEALRTAAENIFTNFNGKGYARLDFRMNDEGKLFFLEINFTCSVFYTAGYEGSADYILQFDGIGQRGFLEHIIAEGIARHWRRQKKYAIKGNAIDGYGIYATQPITKGTIIFKGEGKAQRIITREYVERNWNEKQMDDFRRYAYPAGGDVFILWDDNPAEWAPQNHSCDPNTGYAGLNVIALQNINEGEELTLDYATFLDEQAQPFECHCGSANCRQLIKGISGNAVNVTAE